MAKRSSHIEQQVSDRLSKPSYGTTIKRILDGVIGGRGGTRPMGRMDYEDIHAVAGMNVLKCPYCNSKYANVFIPITISELALIRMGGFTKTYPCKGHGPFGKEHNVKVAFV